MILEMEGKMGVSMTMDVPKFYTVVIPTLNEADNLKLLLPEISNENCSIIVCDNGSTDNTVDVATSLGAAVSHGRGTVVDAILRGLAAAGPGPVVVMDADLSHPPELVTELVDGLFGGRRLAIGSRWQNYDGTKNRLISKVGNLLCWGLCPKVQDRMSGYFCVRKTSLDGIGVNGNFDRSTTKPMLEILVKSGAYDAGEFVEIPYAFKPRLKGKSKLGRGLNLFTTLRHVAKLYIYKYRKMLKFLLVGGVGIGVNLGLLAFFTEVAGIWYMLSAVLGILIATMWNFAMNNLWTFGDRNLKEVWKDKGKWST